MDKEEIDHEYTSEVVCPYCGYEHRDSWDFFTSGDGEYSESWCQECNQPIAIEAHRDVTYTTKKRTEK